MMTRLKRLGALVCGATFFSSLTLTTAQPYIYPNQGQSPQQEQSDKGQCYSWAVQQSGFDPANPQVGMAPPPGMQAPQGGMFRGAAGGAALGAVGGAIGGDAGEGAAIGAGVGALFGGLRRARERREEEQAHAILRDAAAGRHVPGAKQLRARLWRVHGGPRLHGAVRHAR